MNLWAQVDLAEAVDGGLVAVSTTPTDAFLLRWDGQADKTDVPVVLRTLSGARLLPGTRAVDIELALADHHAPTHVVDGQQFSLRFSPGLPPVARGRITSDVSQWTPPWEPAGIAANQRSADWPVMTSLGAVLVGGAPLALSYWLALPTPLLAIAGLLWLGGLVGLAVVAYLNSRRTGRGFWRSLADSIRSFVRTAISLSP